MSSFREGDEIIVIGPLHRYFRRGVLGKESGWDLENSRCWSVLNVGTFSCIYLPERSFEHACPITALSRAEEEE